MAYSCSEAIKSALCWKQINKQYIIVVQVKESDEQLELKKICFSYLFKGN